MSPLAARSARHALLALVIALGGCASSAQLADHWSDPDWRSAPLRNVYVIAVRKDATRRRIWEDGFVTQLRQRGVHATASYVQFPDAVPDTQQVIAAVRAGSYDGVVVSLRLPSRQEEREVPAMTSQEAELRRNP
jgi:hypothetical protein